MNFMLAVLSDGSPRNAHPNTSKNGHPLQSIDDTRVHSKTCLPPAEWMEEMFHLRIRKMEGQAQVDLFPYLRSISLWWIRSGTLISYSDISLATCGNNIRVSFKHTTLINTLLMYRHERGLIENRWFLKDGIWNRGRRNQILCRGKRTSSSFRPCRPSLRPMTEMENVKRINYNQIRCCRL